MPYKWLCTGSFWLHFGPSLPFCVSIRLQNTQAAISQPLYMQITPSLHHSSSVLTLHSLLCVFKNLESDCFGCILTFLHCFVCQSYHNYPNCHISASICAYDPISSKFLIFKCLPSIVMHCKWHWSGSFWLYFSLLVLLFVSIVQQKPKLPYLSFYLSV